MGRGFLAKLRREVAEAGRCLGGELTAEAVHGARLALKRARALAQVGAAWGSREAADFVGEARALLRALGARRDAEVQRRMARRVRRTAPPALRAALGTLERTGGDRPWIDARIEAGDFGGAVDRLRTLAGRWPRTPPGGLAAGVARVIRRARRGWKRARGRPDARLRHRWRRREKERLYIAQLLAAAWPTGVPRRRRVNRKLEATLGEEHDLILLRRCLRVGLSGTASRLGPDAVRGRIERLQRRADALGRRLHAGRA